MEAQLVTDIAIENGLKFALAKVQEFEKTLETNTDVSIGLFKADWKLSAGQIVGARILMAAAEKTLEILIEKHG